MGSPCFCSAASLLYFCYPSFSHPGALTIVLTIPHRVQEHEHCLHACLCNIIMEMTCHTRVVANCLQSLLLWDFTFANTLSASILLLPFFFPQVFDPSKPSMCPSSRQLIWRLAVHPGLASPWAPAPFPAGLSQPARPGLMLGRQGRMTRGQSACATCPVAGAFPYYLCDSEKPT